MMKPAISGDSDAERATNDVEAVEGRVTLYNTPERSSAHIEGRVTTKPSNPKDALGIKKVPISTIPAPVIAELGVAMLEGALKYGRHNYRVIGVRASVYYDAVMARHMPSWWEGEDDDPDSGLSHVTKAIASLVVLRDAMINGTWVDDRPPRPPQGWLTKLNEKVVALLLKYPEPVLPYTQADRTWSEAA
jgi:hypothetical protein